MGFVEMFEFDFADMCAEKLSLKAKTEFGIGITKRLPAQLSDPC